MRPDEELRGKECGKTKDQAEDNNWMEVCNKKDNPEEEKKDERGDKDCEIHKEDEQEGELYPKELDLTGGCFWL